MRPLTSYIFLAAMLMATVLLCSCGSSSSDPQTSTWTSDSPEAPQAASWEPILTEGPVIAAPPSLSSATVQADLAEIRSLQGGLTAAQSAAVGRWDTVNQNKLWRFYLDRWIWETNWAPPSQARVYALVDIAIHDATLASWKAQYQHLRPRPSQLDPAIDPLVAPGQHPSYPSDRAASAAAAGAVLTEVFPARAAEIAAIVAEASQAQVWGGLNLRSDIEAGETLGKAIAAEVLTVAAADGHTLSVYPGQDRDFSRDRPLVAPVPVHFDRTQSSYADAITWDVLADRGVATYDDDIPWASDKPLDPTAGTWNCFVIDSSDAFSIPDPPANSAQETTDDMQEITDALNNRTFYKDSIVLKWANDQPGTWFIQALDAQIRSHRVSTPQAARYQALMTVGIYESLLAAWNIKWDYQKPRPIHLEPTMPTVIPTPGHPSYPSGHATVGGLGIALLQEWFPENEAEYLFLLTEVNDARVWGGVHYRYDMTAGNDLGVQVATEILAKIPAEG